MILFEQVYEYLLGGSEVRFWEKRENQTTKVDHNVKMSNILFVFQNYIAIRTLWNSKGLLRVPRPQFLVTALSSGIVLPVHLSRTGFGSLNKWMAFHHWIVRSFLGEILGAPRFLVLEATKALHWVSKRNSAFSSSPPRLYISESTNPKLWRSVSSSYGGH